MEGNFIRTLLARLIGTEPAEGQTVRAVVEDCRHNLHAFLSESLPTLEESQWIHIFKDDFDSWAEETGAGAKGGASLDSKLLLRPDTRDTTIAFALSMKEALGEYLELARQHNDFKNAENCKNKLSRIKDEARAAFGYLEEFVGTIDTANGRAPKYTSYVSVLELEVVKTIASLGTVHPQVVECMDELANAYEADGMVEEANAVYGYILSDSRKGPKVGCILLQEARQGNTFYLKVILQDGADIESQDSFGRTPLSWAARKGHTDAVRLLCERGANLEVRDREGFVPLLYAIQNQHVDVAKLLLARGAATESKFPTSGRTALHAAAARGHMALVELLCEAGADLGAQDHQGHPPLFTAAREGHADVVQFLLERGADVDARSELGTPLIQATWYGHIAVARHLLDHGANMEATAFNGDTALLCAAKGSRIDIVQFLCEKGADLKASNKHGDTALSHATKKGHEHIIQYLREKGAC